MAKNCELCGRNSSDNEMLFVGPLVAWVSSWILYAFGELVEKTVENEQHTREILKIISEKNDK